MWSVMCVFVGVLCFFGVLDFGIWCSDCVAGGLFWDVVVHGFLPCGWFGVGCCWVVVVVWICICCDIMLAFVGLFITYHCGVWL